MRPLIEILEDERNLMQRLDSVSRYLLKDDDPAVRELLLAQRGKTRRELLDIQDELGERIEKLLNDR
jgi:hypothetical protein